MSIEGKNVKISASYIVGFTEGEGCFLVSIRADNRIDLRFFISQAEGNKDLLLKVKEFFGVGSVYQKKSAKDGKLPAWIFEVTKRDDIFNKIIPFFEKNQLFGYKSLSFEAFKKIAVVVKGRQDKRKLTKDEFNYIYNLKLKMNKHYSLSAKTQKHYGSPGAGNPLAEVGTHDNFDEVQSVKSAKLGAPESRSNRGKVKPAMRIKS